MTPNQRATINAARAMAGLMAILGVAILLFDMNNPPEECTYYRTLGEVCYAGSANVRGLFVITAGIIGLIAAAVGSSALKKSTTSVSSSTNQ